VTKVTPLKMATEMPKHVKEKLEYKVNKKPKYCAFVGLILLNHPMFFI
jgi:hypothetical protein